MKNFYKRGKNFRENYITTLHKLFEYASTFYWKRKMSQFVDDTQVYTYATFKSQVDRMSMLMSRFGISADDKVAILSQNMPNWTVAFFSAVAYGRVAVPILPDSSQNEVTNILNHSESKVMFISQRLLSKLSKECMDKLTLVIDIETFDFIKRDDAAFTCSGTVKEPLPDDLATLIYTSGTTGTAKGVMLSHRNLCHNIMACYHAQKANKKDKWLSILPMAHTYELGMSVLFPIFCGSSVYYIKKAPTPTILAAAMKQVRPTIMCSVPLIIEKVYKSSIAPTVEHSRILSWMKEKTPHIFYHLVGKRVYRSFGGKLKFFGIGGSKLDSTVEEFLLKAKFPYAIGYGLTETSPLICNAMVGKTKIGSTGIAAYGVEVKLDNYDPATGLGEIMARGDNVMIGYYKDPERTRQVIDYDGWFRTKDIASVDEDGYYSIKGRLGNMIVGPSGENIYPEEIEKVINDYNGVNESLVMERNGKLVALVRFDENVLNWNQETEDKFFENLQAKKTAIMEYINKHVSKASKVNEVEVMKDPFDKTATQKIRRFKYKDGDNKSAANSETKSDSTQATKSEAETTKKADETKSSAE
jgi:long-chain acyl-CoA synthetase